MFKLIFQLGNLLNHPVLRDSRRMNSFYASVTLVVWRETFIEHWIGDSFTRFPTTKIHLDIVEQIKNFSAPFILRSFDENKPHLLHNERNQIEKCQNIPRIIPPTLNTYLLPSDSTGHMVVVHSNQSWNKSILCR